MLNQIIHGDCLEVMQGIHAGSVDMILCDLPYGTTACKWDTIIPFEPLWEQYERIIKPNGAIVLTASQPFTSKLIMSNEKLFKYCLVWEKSKSSDFINANYRPMKKHEDICVFSKGGSNTSSKNPMAYYPQGLIYSEKKRVRSGSLGIARDRESQQGEYISRGSNYPTSVLKFANVGENVHPTQKPLDLFQYLILTFTKENEIVLDNCMGSATTAIAAASCGRNFIGIEKELKYVNVANQRLEYVQPVMNF